MAWKGVHLSCAARLGLGDGQLIVTQEDGKVRIPLEDIAYLVLDTTQATMTTALVSACMAAGVVIVFTDAHHTPAGLTLPFHSHHRQAGVAALQQACAAPRNKRLWQSIVVAKIANQAAALTSLGRDGASALTVLARLVGSGDSDNVEARAARDYWGRLFPAFIREGSDDYRNKCLNYGYAVVRAGIARALVAYGLLPALGLHHASVSNAFNLADDLVEPFRPFVDVAVWRLASEGTRHDGDPSKPDRQILAGLPMTKAKVGRDTVTLLVAMVHAAESLVQFLETTTPVALRLPRLMESTL